MATTMNLKELYWAAGFIEGEGYFGCMRDKRGANHLAPRMTVAQKDIESLERLSRIFVGAKMYRAKSGVTNWTLYGNKAIGVMMTLWPLMSSRRQKKIEEVIALWKTNISVTEYTKSRQRIPTGQFMK